MKAKYIWCTLAGHFLNGFEGYRVRGGKDKPPKKARCPDCGKQFKVEMRNDFNDEWRRYYVPPHKKRVK